MLKNERRECWSGSPDSPSWLILLPALPSRRGFCQRDAFQGTTTTSTSTSTRSHEFWWVQWGTNKVHSGIHPQMLRLQQDTRNQLQFLIRCSVLCIFVPSSAISPAWRPHAPAPSSVPSLPLLTERAGVPGSLASAQSAHRCDFLWVVRGIGIISCGCYYWARLLEIFWSERLSRRQIYNPKCHSKES